MKTARDTIIAFIAQLATFAISIISSVLIARFLGLEGKGILAVLLRVAGASQGFAQWGIQESLLPLSKEYRDSPKLLSGNALALGTILGCSVSLLIILAYPVMAGNILKGITQEQLIWIMCSVPLTVLGLFLGRLVQLRSTHQYNAGQIITAIFSIVGFALAFWLWQNDVIAGIVGFVASQAIACTIYLAFGLNLSLIGFQIKWSLVRDLLHSGSSMQFGLMASLLATQIGTLVLNNYTDSSQVGLFTTAAGLANMLLFFSGAVRLVLQNRMIASNSESDLADLTTRVTRHTIIWLITGAIGFGILGNWLIEFLYGVSFTPAYPMLLYTLPGIVAVGIMQILASYFIAKRQLGFTSIVAIIIAIANLTMLFGIGEKLDGITASVVQTIASFLWVTIYLVYFLRITKQSWIALIPKNQELNFYSSLIISVRSAAKQKFL